jgi:hypothetical protein
MMEDNEQTSVAQVSSALVEEERGGRMPQGMSGNDWHPRALAGEIELNAWLRRVGWLLRA